MRLWHTAILQVLPKQQFNGQLREIIALITKNKPHILINFARKDDKDTINQLSDYIDFYMKLREERGYKTSLNTICKINDWKYNNIENFNINKMKIIDVDKIFPDKMNERYFIQCYKNIEEKYDCSGVSEDEWVQFLDYSLKVMIEKFDNSFESAKIKLGLEE